MTFQVPNGIVKPKKPTRCGGPYANLNQELINPSLETDLICPDEITRVFPDFVWTEEQIRSLEGAFPSPRDLYELKMNGYGLIPYPSSPTSIADVQRMAPSLFLGKCVADDWYKNQAFANTKNENQQGWLAVKKEPIKGSLGREFGDQKILLFSPELMPSAFEFVWFCTIFRAVRGEILFENLSVRTATLDSVGRNVVVGNGRSGISFSGDLDIACSRWGIPEKKVF